jgi:hypothetical protein
MDMFSFNPLDMEVYSIYLFFCVKQVGQQTLYKLFDIHNCA